MLRRTTSLTSLLLRTQYPSLSPAQPLDKTKITGMVCATSLFVLAITAVAVGFVFGARHDQRVNVISRRPELARVLGGNFNFDAANNSAAGAKGFVLPPAGPSRMEVAPVVPATGGANKPDLPMAKKELDNI